MAYKATTQIRAKIATGVLLVDAHGLPAGSTVRLFMPATPQIPGSLHCIERIDGGLFPAGPGVTASRTRATVPQDALRLN